MQCPKCNNEMWDNRPKKTSGEFKPSSPDYKCKNKDCQHVIWPEKGEHRESMEQPSNNFQKVKETMQTDRNDGLATQIFEARKRFQKAWSEAEEIMRLIPEKDAQEMSVDAWYEHHRAIAMYFAIRADRHLP